ncbi:MAG: DNA-protecting protein DprA [Candidatus Bipolaricaulota bacterium]|nr:DNA-protecting protein DprA [Candidatus Bipolaricaulota bacterium]MCS7273978.1 DNA-protecting protein DprA [Candidatus Bipolaricaulota bacterium]MDW8111331.1 DNA-processing protein DprA [Candidatus Bipolaricaulota bacterium]MDW8329249.1 DNA-processing protein DprA [Candidatus Bipolaricaulota bacterium]
MSKLHWFALSKVKGLGGARARRLLEHFGSVEALWQADPETLAALTGLPSESFSILQPALDDAPQEIESLHREGIAVVTPDDDPYPVLLRDLRDAPSVLYLRGSLETRDQWAVAIVGSRLADPGHCEQKMAWTHQLAQALAEWGVTIVSGLAHGVDSWAHGGALEARDGRTIAVLGCGLRRVYPKQNRALADRIVARGALLSELDPNLGTCGPFLMMRDRLIAALSQAVIVIEAGDPSGSLDTARHALKLQRRVLAVPGSPGTEKLIAEGAEKLEPDRADIDELARSILSMAEMER